MASVNGGTVAAWHTDVLPRATKHALDFLAHESWLARSSWYLAGGTALALAAGHRSSVDLDFFNPKGFSTPRLLNRFPKNVWATERIPEGTVYGQLLGSKVSFIEYPFFVPRRQFKRYGAVRVLQPEDIAVMKIIAVSQRGRKRDFVDLYWYAKNCEPLLEAVRRLPNQYPTVAHNYHHILKSLMYFTDAEDDPMPKLFFDADWKRVKQFFTREVPLVTRAFLGLR